MSKLLTPSEIVNSITDVSLTNFDFEKATNRFKRDESKFLALSLLKFKRNTAKVILTGELATGGVMVSEFENKSKAYSIALTLDQIEDHQAFEELEDYLQKQIPDGDYSLSSPARDERLYVKLKPAKDGKSFSVKNNLSLNPAKSENSGLYQGQKVEVTCQIGVYVNLKEKTAGLTITPLNIKFEVDVEEPPAKKQKK